jgi:protease-4
MDSNLPPEVPTPSGYSTPPPPLMAPPPLARTQPPKRSRLGWWLLGLGGVALLGVLVLAAVFASALTGGGVAAHTDGDSLLETVIENNGARHKIAVIEVDGIIMDLRDQWTGASLVSFLKDQLDRAAEDARVKAVLLRIDSPGGEVLASDEISKAIAEFQKDSGKPVVASMGSLAASGGYYIAAPCRWIVANEMTITGSIGVIMSSWNYRGLMNKVGVKPETFKSGRFKDMLSGEKEPAEITAEERAMVQSLVDETYGRFTEVVAEGRGAAARLNKGEGRALARDWKSYADGRILSGRQAHEHGFVDELGNFDDAVARALALAGISEANLVQYHLPQSFASLFRLFGRTEAPAIKLDLGLDAPRLQAGKLYFLSPTLLH